MVALLLVLAAVAVIYGPDALSALLALRPTPTPDPETR
jgi:hypothetical protein